MKKIIMLVIAGIMMVMLLAACNSTVVTKTTVRSLGNDYEYTYYTIGGERMTEEEYQVWRSEGLWR